MSNTQIFPQSVYPLNGDVESTPGSPDIVVTGLQAHAIASTPPIEGQFLKFTSGAWTPAAESGNRSISVNGIAISDDYEISVNNVDVSTNQVNSAFPANGAPIFVNGVSVP